MKKNLMKTRWNLKKEETEEEDVKEKEMSEKDETNNDDEELSEKLFSYEFILDGEKYTLPADVKKFLDNGWKLRENDSLDNGYTIGTELKKGTMSFHIWIYNTSGKVLKFEDCKVSEVTISNYHSENREAPEFKMGNGIEFGTDFSIIKNIYGKPEKENIGDTISTLQYNEVNERFNYDGIKFSFDKDSKLNEVNFSNEFE